MSYLQIVFDVGVCNVYWRSTFVLITAWTLAHKYLHCVEYSDVFDSDSLIYFAIVLQRVLKVWVIIGTFISLPC